MLKAIAVVESMTEGWRFEALLMNKRKAGR